MVLLRKIQRSLHPEQIFVISGLVVNGGNYLYNLVLGRVLGPSEFADAAILITLLLVLSFVAMTFQLAVAKFSAEFETQTLTQFVRAAFRVAIVFGISLGAIVVLFARQFQAFFHTQTSEMFTIFGMAIPLYFIMSVNRGSMQGKQEFVKLSLTYQSEMWSRLLITFVLILLLQLSSSVAVAIGVGLSFVIGIFPIKKASLRPKKTMSLPPEQVKRVRVFFLLTACYECTQIICNNSDILLVKHFFESTDAGLYASMALIGRVVYFITWMFVMLLLPKVIEKRKCGVDPRPILRKYIRYIVFLSSGIVLFTFSFPSFTVALLFGEAYLSIAPLLGWYALATALFAVSNVYAYYFLSLDKYMPIVFAGIFGMGQIGLIIMFHDSLFEVVLMQVIAMACLLLSQLGYYKVMAKNNAK